MYSKEVMYPETLVQLNKIEELLKSIHEIDLNSCEIGEIESILFQAYQNGYSQGYADCFSGEEEEIVIEND